MSVGIDSVRAMTTSTAIATRLTDEHQQRLAETIADALAPNTLRAYRSASARYRTWLSIYYPDADPWDPMVVAAHLSTLVETAPSTVEIARAAILWACGQSGAGADVVNRLRDNPGIRATMRGIRRQQRGWITTKAKALSRGDILRMVEHCDSRTPVGRRDRALVLVMASLGLRASDAVAILAGGCVLVPSGGGSYEISVPYSKTSDESVTLALPSIGGGMLDATEALTSWLDILAALDGERGRGRLVRPVRRGGWSVGGVDTECSTEVVATVVKRAAEAAGLSTGRGEITSHSLRASFATGALQHYSEAAVAAVGRWSSLSTLRGYDRTSAFAPERAAGGWLGR